MNSSSPPPAWEPSSVDPIPPVELAVIDAYRDALRDGERVEPEQFIERYPNARGALPALHALAEIYGGHPRSTDTPRREEGTIQSSSVISQLPAPVIAGYDRFVEIGRGGMGVVYKARQVATNRWVAIKMIHPGRCEDRLAAERFLREPRLAAKLRHPNIVSVFEAGVVDGRPFFSMEHVDGWTLAQLSREQSVSLRQAAEYVKGIAAAIQHAHDHGVWHRDLKPANVMIDATGQPRVTDFGLARAMEGTAELTGSGDVVGTASYMSPEQAGGRSSEVGPLSDVYALGATFYELLTGRPPFRGDTPVDTLWQVRELDPVAPRALNPELDCALETICLKSLAKEPTHRYASAAHMAQDIERWLKGEPILARRANGIERLWRWCRRNRALAILEGAICLIVAATPRAAGSSLASCTD